MTEEANKAGRVRHSVTAALLAALLCLPASAQVQTITGKVVGVSDGDTLTVLDSERNRVPFKTEAEAQTAGYRKAKNCPQ
jgi:endonuclease YncB( thermonuclease family)